MNKEYKIFLLRFGIFCLQVRPSFSQPKERDKKKQKGVVPCFYINLTNFMMLWVRKIHKKKQTSRIDLGNYRIHTAASVHDCGFVPVSINLTDGINTMQI